MVERPNKRMRSGNTGGSPSAISKSEFAVIFDIMQQQGVNARCYNCECTEHVLDESDNVTLRRDEALDTVDLDGSQRLLCEFCSNNAFCEVCETHSETVEWVEIRNEEMCRSCREKNDIEFCFACETHKEATAWVDIRNEEMCRSCRRENDDIGFCESCMDYRLDVHWYGNEQHVHRADGFDRDNSFFSACNECRARYAGFIADH